MTDSADTSEEYTKEIFLKEFEESLKEMIEMRSKREAESNDRKRIDFDND